MFMMKLSDACGGSRAPLNQRRVLLVEDDYLVGLSIKSMLEDIGYMVIGPIASLAKAMEAVETELVDAAVLDINISGGTSVPVAQLLMEQNLPFVFVTGYQSPDHLLPDRLRVMTQLNKPIDEQSLSRALCSALQ
jgi:two-component SAPR family response regulator